MINWHIQQIAIFGWFVQALASKVGKALVIRARAGTGKTTTGFEAILRFVAAAREAGKRVNVLFCAFAKINADEGQARIAKLGIGDTASARTLHSLGNLFVIKALGKRKPRNIDSGKGRARYLALKAAPSAHDDAIALITELNQKAREIEPFATVAKLEALAYQFEIEPDADLEKCGWGMTEICEATLKAMKIGAQDFTSMDYADMIFWPLVNNWVYPMFDLTVVDEAQDMTRAQLELALCATHEDGHVVLAGDDRQAIYGFRGADSGSLDRLKTELNADELGLTVTYRCPKLVVEMARKFVPDYEAAPEAPEGEIKEVTIDKMLLSVMPRDFILSRTNAPLASLCLALIRDGKRAYIRGRDVGQGIIGVVRKLKCRDMSDLPGALAAWRDKEIARVDRKRKPGDESQSNAVADLIRDRAQVIEILADGCTSIAELIARIESMFETPKPGTPETRIMLATVHKAKGLEAPNVFTLESTFKRKGGEEDNIRYVAITRSQGGLYLVTDEANEVALAA